MTGRTVSDAPGYAPDDDLFDPIYDDFVSKERKYTHFDLRLSDEAREAIRATPDAIIKNAFWPLLGFAKAERRVKRDSAGSISFEVKNREIKFGSHRDAALFEHYSAQLSQEYERTLAQELFSGSVLAYRRGIGSNVVQAKSLFDEIGLRRDVTAIALDISGFFDHIRHDVLLSSLRTVLGTARLLDHDFVMFRRMTKFDWVDAESIDHRLRGVKRPKGRICDSYQFRKHIRTKEDNLVKSNPNEFGIPQGTPLSGLYANISLLGFDGKLNELVASLGGSMRRYSDDIAILLPLNVSSTDVVESVRNLLCEIGLSLSDKKTEIRTFREKNGSAWSDKPFQYLGFTFDGKKILIRQSSLNRYYSKMHSGVYAKIAVAKSKSVPRDSIFMRELYRKYTHFGMHRNFPRYAYRASDIMNAPEIRKQLASHFAIFKLAIQRSLESIY